MIDTVLSYAIKQVPDCAHLPRGGQIYGKQQPAHSLGGLTSDFTAAQWLAFAFESVCTW